MRDRREPTPDEIKKALENAAGSNGTSKAPKDKDKIRPKKEFQDYAMVSYTNGHHFSSSSKKYRNYTAAFLAKMDAVENPRKFSILQGAYNNILRIHRRDNSIGLIQPEMDAIKLKLDQKANEFDVNPKIAALLEFGEDLTKKARDGKIDDCIGREDEMGQMMLNLGKRKKANPILTGDPGVGKTQLVHGLAHKIVRGEAGWLNGYSIVELSTTDLVSGTKFVGSLQEKMKKILAAIEGCPNAIIFTDEIHNLMGTGKGINGTQDLANILKPVLASGDVKWIGATTQSEYKIITKDAAMERRFNEIEVKELSVDDTRKVLLNLADTYGSYHGLDYTNEAIHLTPVLSKRYAGKTKYLPDSAIDLMDMAGATAKMDGTVDITVDYLIQVASDFYDQPVDEIVTEELSKQELKTTIGFI